MSVSSRREAMFSPHTTLAVPKQIVSRRCSGALQRVEPFKYFVRRKLLRDSKHRHHDRNVS
jgi:hypothetical protein